MSIRHRPFPLRLRGAARNFTWDTTGVWAWFVLAPSRWSFLTDDAREKILSAQAAGWAELDGRQFQVRVTHRPYSGQQWAHRLDRDNPDQLDRDAFRQMTDDTREQMQVMSTAEAVHYLGVQVGPRGVLDRVTAALPGRVYDVLDRRWRIAGRDQRRLRTDIARVTQTVTDSLDGWPAEPHEVDFLIGQSRGLGCRPGPAAPNTAPVGPLDVFAYTDGVDVTEHPAEPYLTVRDTRGDRRPVSRYVTVLTLGRADRIQWPPPHLPLLAISNSLGFPVEVNVTGRILTGRAAERGLNRQLVRVTSEINAYLEVGETPPPALTARRDHALRVGSDLEEPVPADSARWKGHVRFAVSGDTPEQVADRAQKLREAYLAQHIPLHREPQARELAAEFIPHEPVGSAAYDRQTPVKMFAAFLPQVTSEVGDRSGVLIGTTVSGPRRPVLFHPNAGPEVHQHAGLVPIIGGLGSGKSFLAGLITEQSLLCGVRATVLDPSAGAFTRLAERPELAAHSRVIDLVHGLPGSLSPWAVVADPHRDHFDTDQQFRDAVVLAGRERMVLAEDVCRALLPAELAGNTDLRMALTDAVSDVGGDQDRSLYHVVDALGRGSGDLAQAAARYLTRMADYPRAYLFFDNTDKRETIEEALVVVTFSGLSLPKVGDDRSRWTTEQQVSVPLLNLATALTFRRVARKPRRERHLLVLDELGILQDFPSFRSVFTRVSSDSRKLNTGVLQLAQHPRTVIDMDLLPYVGSAFVGATKSKDAAEAALRILGVDDHDDGRYARVLRELPRPGRNDRRIDYRDFLYGDNCDRVERVRVTAGHRPGLGDVLDTNPTQQTADQQHADPAGEPA